MDPTSNTALTSSMSEDDTDTREELWAQLVEVRRRAGVSQAMLARRLGMTQQNLSYLEVHGPEVCRLSTLQRLLGKLTGWTESITGPENPIVTTGPPTPEEQAKRDRRREQKRQAAQRWRARHPEKADEYARRYRTSPQGKEYQRSYGRMRRALAQGVVEQEQSAVAIATTILATNSSTPSVMGVKSS